MLTCAVLDHMIHVGLRAYSSTLCTRRTDHHLGGVGRGGGALPCTHSLLACVSMHDTQLLPYDDDTRLPLLHSPVLQAV